MNSEKLLVDEIINYYMNPDKYPEKNKKEIEQTIKNVDSYLMQQNDEKGKSVFDKFGAKYSATSAPINLLIRKTRADDEGVSATRGYKEIYFNEIIQNANDNTSGSEMDICVDYDSQTNQYSVRFKYEDKGFSVENIVGFFNTEIHTKRKNLSATGKHGVGIKALFYFCDELIIESNVLANFKINTIIEDGIEKIDTVESELRRNEKWDKVYTNLIVKYQKKENYGEFNVKKLNELIDLVIQGNNTEEIKPYLFGKNQEKLIFDVRSLLFTNKNKNKDKGIKEISFSTRKSEKLFSIRAESDGKIISLDYGNESFKAEKCSLKLSEQIVEQYYVFVRESAETDVQNFAMALPMGNMIANGRRYYETYYIPGEDDNNELNFLINSKFSSIDRTKLTDDDNKKETIKEEIENEIVSVLRKITSKEFQNAILENSEWRSEISAIFHKCMDNNQFINCCYKNFITNRYLAKYKCSEVSEEKYIVYKREDKEPYEKMIIGQSWSKEEAKNFFEKYILQDDTIQFSEDNYIDEVKEVYLSAFNNENKENKRLQYILNAVGSLENLVRLRICGNHFAEEISEEEMDNWLNEINYTPVEIPLSIIARYKLHSGVTLNGKISGVSFYEYLFNKQSSGVFANAQKKQFDGKYIKLKERLQQLLVNREKSGTAKVWGAVNKNGDSSYDVGEVAFFASWHHKAGGMFIMTIIRL